MAAGLSGGEDGAMLSVHGGIRFTERQRQVVRLIAAGCSNVEIADTLGVSPRTAKAHADVLRAKLGVSRRRQIPAAFREATGEDPLRSLEAALGARDDSSASG
jgi:ATP/maltotriose-dependent transcriptional regulator MalT